MKAQPGPQGPARPCDAAHYDAPTSDGFSPVRSPEEDALPQADSPTFPRRGRRGAAAAPSPPPTLAGLQVGADLAGFHLLAELGQGAFGRVFLARQGDLADREVVLKVSPSVELESRILARLQHTNIVPVYSIHRAGPVQAVCMPYFGATTLAHVIKGLADSPSLPQSGDVLLATVNARRSTLADAAASGAKVVAPQPPALPVPLPIVGSEGGQKGANGPTEILQGLSYVDAILWIGQRLADGLSHAHERGILHRDLKPANVLLTDEGQPMLLDFNLAQDTARHGASAAQVGGTLPFMAPEQLEALRRDVPLLEPTGDVYSLGVILYELLTGLSPYPHHAGPVKDVIAKMIPQRQGPPPSVRRHNRAVSPAVEAIVRHCLEPNPARRYQSARELKEDLERQLENKPLLHVREPSVRERAGKWARRHPRLASMTTVCIVAAALFAGLLGLVVARGQRLADLDAQAKAKQFHEDRKPVQYALTARTGDAAQVDAGVEQARALLGRYDVLGGRDWRQGIDIRRLSAADREALNDAVGELLLLLTRGVALQAAGRQDAAAKGEAAAEALRYNELAEECYGGEGSRALWLLRAEVYRLLGRADEAKAVLDRAEATPLRTPQDSYLVAADLLSKNQPHQALLVVTEATRRDPRDFWCWFMLGVCHDSLGQNGDAVACYSTCLALSPESPWASYNRGLAHARLARTAQAIADFDQTINARPAMAEAYLNRALAYSSLKQYDKAIRDLDRALAEGAPESYVRLLRADARERSGDRDGAQEDRKQGMRIDPTDEKGWLTRGYARLATEPKAALADFERALSINPKSLSALQNTAHLLSKMGRNQEALKALDKVVEAYPGFVNGRAGRGVLLARLGKRTAAHADAEECLSRDKAPLTAYQLAGVYALTSREVPGDRMQALRLLSSALQRGVGHDLMETDKDLDPIRKTPEFVRLVEASRAIRAVPSNERTDKR